MDTDEFERHLKELAQNVAEEANTDILIYSGPIDQAGADKVIGYTRKGGHRDNILLLLATYGGNAHASFRIARALGRKYKSVTVYIHRVCKSAGTLVAIGADEIVLSDYGELGPLDVQIRKEDELFGETSSGLNVMNALDTLGQKAYELFENCLIKTKARSAGQVTTKSAIEMAANLSTGLFAPIYQQIDPVRLGEISRAMTIAEDYGQRINRGNLRPDALADLVALYPSHGFVIDREEAENLFYQVREPKQVELDLARHLNNVLFEPRDEACVYGMDELGIGSQPDTGKLVAGESVETTEPSDEDTHIEESGGDTKEKGEANGEAAGENESLHHCEPSKVTGLR